MKNNQKIILLLTIAIIILLVSVVFLVFRSNSSKNLGLIGRTSPGGEQISPNGSTNENPNKPVVTISDEAQIPKIVTGLVTSVNSEKIVIQQFASYELNYIIKKSDLSKLVTLKINSNFDRTKAEEYVKKQLEKAKNDQNNNSNKKTRPPAPPSDPSLSLYIEKNIDWDDIPVEAQVILQTDTEGVKKLIVYPKEMNLTPPATPPRQ